MRYARIQGGRVREIVDLPEGVEPKDRFHPSLDFRMCDPAVQQGWRYEDGAFLPPEPLSIEDARAVTTARIKAHARTLITATGLPWMVERQVSGGAAIPDGVRKRAAAIRQASAQAEAEAAKMRDPARLRAFDVAAFFEGLDG